MKHFIPITTFDGSEATTPDTPVTVTLTVQEWMGIQMALGFSMFASQERDEPETAACTLKLLTTLREQTTPAIDALDEPDEDAA